jgi:hypothetical protein
MRRLADGYFLLDIGYPMLSLPYSADTQDVVSSVTTAREYAGLEALETLNCAS